ncbi:TPA: hypothetical protein ACF3XN_003399 [Vibrio parahaemolyticus]
MSDLFELKFSESPFKQAMDVYYDQFEELVNAGSSYKIVLTSNIVDFPIRQMTPMYNSYIGRAFGDRCISSGSPKGVEEKFLGPANVNDRFSVQMGILLNKAISSVNVGLDQASQNKIEESERRLNKFEDSLNELIADVLSEWEVYKATHLQNMTEDEISIRMTAWLEIHRLRRRIDVATGRIDRELTFQEQVIAGVGNDEDSHIYRAYNAWRNSQVAFPKSPELESKYKLDPIKMGNPLLVGTNPSWADVGADVDSLADWDNFLTVDGVRAFSISRTDTTTNTHERSWSASATFRYKYFFSARVSAAEHTRMKNTIIDSSSVKMEFKRISEVWLRRGDWYDSSLFSLPKIVTILKKNKKLSANLKYSVSSLIVGRGFNLTLAFNNNNHYEYFRDFSASGSAKILNVFPVGRGTVNENTTKIMDHEATKSVSFVDSPSLCRLLGFKVDEMHQLLSDEEALTELGLFNFESEEFENYIKHQYNLDDDYKFL